MPAIKRALVSVSDKTGIVEFCKKLQERKIEILSTGGTCKLLSSNGIKVEKIEDYIQFPEILDGRVKTINPRIAGGILAMRSNPEHKAQIAQHGIKEIDLVVVDLYPFEKVTANADVALQDAIENIDIGGITLIRAAAKNYQDVSILCSRSDYEAFLAELEKGDGSVSKEYNFQLMKKAFLRTADYDARISAWLCNYGNSSDTPDVRLLRLEKVQNLRYGENPHQKAAFYRAGEPLLLSDIKQLQGKELSFNNILDMNAVFELAAELKRYFPSENAVVIVKHNNPCGIALGSPLKEAYLRAYQSDTISAFGGIISVTQELDGETAEEISKTFYEVIIAPSFSEKAREILSAKKNLRLVVMEDLKKPVPNDKPGLDIKTVRGGVLIQETDDLLWNEPKVVTKKQPSASEMDQLKLAFIICKFVKSNAVVFAKENMMVSLGSGQTSRIFSAEQAIKKAERFNLSVQGSCLASEAFFPFRDSIDAAAAAGVKAIIQPGGSVRDQEVIAAADEHGIAMVFTGMRHFRH
jgi:phosphoribosylaminoimidazolecarboxamide formyltransferase/IMP cyclohydrolase